MKKLITLLTVILLLAGCSGKKEAPVKEEVKTEEKEPVSIESEETNETVYGTWRTCAVSIKDARFTMEQIEAMGEKDSVDAIFVLNEDGTIYAYEAYGEARFESVWEPGTDNTSVIIENQKLPIVDGEIVIETENGTLYMEKISDRQDKGMIDELIQAEPQNTIEEPEPETQEIQEENEEEAPSDAIRPEVKEAIDAYEDFVDEYIAFMKKYEDSDGTDLSILLDYTKFMTNLTEYTDKMESLEDDMTEAETFYYIEVMNRCNEKMMKELN